MVLAIMMRYGARMSNLVLVFAGGGLGAVARYLVGAAALRQFGSAFPAGTIIVNVVGSFLMGLLIVWLMQRGPESGEPSANLRLFLATGFLGGFTTFSAFSLDFSTLWERGDALQALIYAVCSVGLSVAAIFAGLLIGRSILS